MIVNILHFLRIIKFGWKNLWLHKLRSLLTVLGIVFGVASVIAMLAIGEGASFEAREKIKELGSHNIIIISVEPPSEAKSQQVSSLGFYGLNSLDLRKIRSIPSVEKVIPTWEMQEQIWHSEKNISGRIVATIPEYVEVANLNIAEGRFFNDIDFNMNSSVAVIGSSIKNTLFPMKEPVGKEIKVKGNYFRIIGIVTEKLFSTSTETFKAEDINFDIYIPLSTERIYFGEYVKKPGSSSRGIGGSNWIKFHRFIVKVKEIKKIIGTSSIIGGILNSTHKKTDYEILVPLQLLKQAEHTKRIFNIVLGSIAAISLLVGGIGIMNIMLATVTERTREIGIRRAIGAKRKDVIYQFLTEAIILSSSGGIIGVIFGITIPRIVTKFSGMTTMVTFWSVFLAFFISVAIGITFGIYPARRAAFLDPIQALRYE